jgi:hypothetical protein
MAVTILWAASRVGDPETESDGGFPVRNQETGEDSDGDEK